MSALRFARIVANTVHECAPDHSTHTIAVGELREAVAEMEALYEALDALLNHPKISGCRPVNGDLHGGIFHACDEALKLARGEA